MDEPTIITLYADAGLWPCPICGAAVFGSREGGPGNLIDRHMKWHADTDVRYMFTGLAERKDDGK